jgi:hypothetical protein
MSHCNLSAAMGTGPQFSPAREERQPFIVKVLHALLPKVQESENWRGS